MLSYVVVVEKMEYIIDTKGEICKNVANCCCQLLRQCTNSYNVYYLERVKIWHLILQIP